MSKINEINGFIDNLGDEILYQNMKKIKTNEILFEKYGMRFSSPLEYHRYLLTKQLGIQNKYKNQKSKLMLIQMIKKLFDSHIHDCLERKCNESIQIYHNRIQFTNTNNDIIKAKNVIEKEFPYKKFKGTASVLDGNRIISVREKSKIAHTEPFLKEQDDELFVIADRCIKSSKVICEINSTIWTNKEKMKFFEFYSKKPKCFVFISQSIGTKSVSECIEFFYRNRMKIRNFNPNTRKFKKVDKNYQMNKLSETPLLVKSNTNQKLCLHVASETTIPPLQPLSKLASIPYESQHLSNTTSQPKSRTPSYDLDEQDVANILLQLGGFIKSP